MPTFRTLVAILSLFAFVVFVWYLTPYVSFAGFYPLESVTARLVLSLS